MNKQFSSNPSPTERTSTNDRDSKATPKAPEGRPTALTPKHPLQALMHDYLASMRNLSETIQIVLPHLSDWLHEETKKQQKKLDDCIPDSTKQGSKQSITFESARDFVEFISTIKKLDQLEANRALPVLARSLFMQIFCEFDAFMGSLLKVIYLRKEDLLKGISREISLTALLEYDSLETVKHAMLDKEIETFRRDSYVDQFAHLEKTFSLALRKFPEWAEFVELSQRRNIFTHNDGMVSDQYILVCEREGWQFKERPQRGQALESMLRILGARCA